MARVSLIVPVDRDFPTDEDRLGAAHGALVGAGHEVEVLLASGPVEGRPRPERKAGWTWVEAAEPGRAAAAIAGLERAGGDVLLVYDPTVGYEPEDLARLVASLASGRAEVAVASRFAVGPDGLRIGRLKAGVGTLARALTGSSDPLSGLIGLTREARDHVSGTFRAVGSQFALELLGRVRGRRVDVPARPSPSSSARRTRPGLDDVRHLKRLADHRFGNFSRLIQFCVVGTSGMVVDLSCYALLQVFLRPTMLAGLQVPPTRVTADLALSRVLAIAVALLWNFSLNRRLTFSYAREGSVPRQFITYMASNLLGVLVSLALSLGLPRHVAFFGAHRLLAALVGIVAATGLSFTMSRWLVFRLRPTPSAPSRPRRRRCESASRPESTAAR